MKVENFINKSIVKKYFILDSHEKGVPGQSGTVFEDEDFIKYSYKPSKNNKLIIGSAFLYRKPGNNFRLIGGGYISSISEMNADGYKTATITNGFQFLEPIRKGDPFLEQFEWEKKYKPGVGWKGFWTNYGILEIEESDFWGLVSNKKCKPGIAESNIHLEEINDLDINIDLKNEIYDTETQFVYNDSPVQKPDPITNKAGRVYYPRNRKISKNALMNANYKCEYDNSHSSFIRRGTNIQYCEPHHLIPMHYQEAFNYSLDVEENIISLCSNCHNLIHYGEDAKDLLIKLFENRKEDLKRVGIEVDLETLLSMYDL